MICRALFLDSWVSDLPETARLADIDDVNNNSYYNACFRDDENGDRRVRFLIVGKGDARRSREGRT